MEKTDDEKVTEWLAVEWEKRVRFVIALIIMILVSTLLYWGGAIYVDGKKAHELGISSIELNTLRDKKLSLHGDRCPREVLAKQDFAETALAIKEKNPGFPKKTSGPAYSRAMQKAEERVKSSCADANSEVCVQAKLAYTDTFLLAVDF